MLYYTIYKVTNIVNNKIYIGLHRTKNLNDTYLGSGKIIKDALIKYGRHNFIKEILYIFDNFDDMINKERELVNESFILRSDTYNVIKGGTVDYKSKCGENNPMYGRKKTPEQIEKTVSKLRGKPITNGALKKLQARTGENNPMYGRKKTPEQIEKTVSKLRGKSMPFYAVKKSAESKYKPVICKNNIEHISIKHCAQYYNVKYFTIQNWIKNPKKNFCFKNVQLNEQSDHFHDDV